MFLATEANVGSGRVDGPLKFFNTRFILIESMPSLTPLIGRYFCIQLYRIGSRIDMFFTVVPFAKGQVLILFASSVHLCVNGSL